MLIDQLLSNLITENRKDFFLSTLNNMACMACPEGAIDMPREPLFIDLKDGLAKLAGQISDKFSRIKYSRTLDRQTYFKGLSREETLEFENYLKERFNNVNKSYSRYLNRFSDKIGIFQINSLISLAFYLQLSFDEFRALAKLAGYSFDKNTPYPPYYFLKELLQHKSFDYSQYRRAVTNADFIRQILEETDILSLNCFNENNLRAFFQKHSQKYKMTFDEALKDLSFQTDYLSYFLESVYITGSLTENRRIDAA